MRNLLLFSGILLFCSATSLQYEGCECGDHEQGITTFNVEEGQGCCTGTPGGVGYVTTYEYSEGAWKVSGQDQITGSAAQDECCPSE